jgi:hypothetical protein
MNGRDCLMSTEEKSIREDISYMRQLAESGRRGPILGGIFLAAAGIVFGLACIVSWAGRTGMLQVRDWNDRYVWFAAGGIFTVYWAVTMIRVLWWGKRSAGAANATFGTVWSASGIGVMVAFGTTELVAHNLNASIILNAYIPVIYAFYGTAWFASAALARQRWMFLAAFGSFVFAFVIALLAENDLQSPAMGAGLLLLLTLPGLKLMTSEARP